MLSRITHLKNKTVEHYTLKQVARYLIWNQGYRNIATEVMGFHEYEEIFPSGCINKKIIDYVGIKK